LDDAFLALAVDLHLMTALLVLFFELSVHFIMGK